MDLATPTADDSDAGVKARRTEDQMTDDEEFSLLRSLMIVVFGRGGILEPRVPDDVPAVGGLGARPTADDLSGAEVDKCP